MTETLTDIEIIEEFKGGNTSIFNRLMTNNFNYAYKIAYRILKHHEDTEDVVNESFMSVYKNLEKFRGEANFKTWLFRIVSNSAKNRYRWNKKRFIHENNSMDDENNSFSSAVHSKMQAPSHASSYKELLDAVHAHLDSITPVYKDVFLMRVSEGMSYEDISSVTGLSLGTVKSRIFRARNELREKLLAEGAL